MGFFHQCSSGPDPQVSWNLRTLVVKVPGRGQRGQPPALTIPPSDAFLTVGICLPFSQVQRQMADLGVSVPAAPVSQVLSH